MYEELGVKYLISDFSRLREVVYARNLAGGDLHIVLDDENVEDEHLDFCKNLIIKNTDDPDWYKIVCLAILKMLRDLSIEDRENLVTS